MGMSGVQPKPQRLAARKKALTLPTQLLLALVGLVLVSVFFTVYSGSLVTPEKGGEVYERNVGVVDLVLGDLAAGGAGAVTPLPARKKTAPVKNRSKTEKEDISSETSVNAFPGFSETHTTDRGNRAARPEPISLTKSVMKSWPLPALLPASSLTSAQAAAENRSTEGKDPSFSACVLIMDENHRLPEWLAYHYYALKLRYVVAAIDPRSKTSPAPIFDMWRDRLNVTIVEWTDVNFTRWNLTIDPGDGDEKRLHKHRNRQNAFYRACTRHLMARNRTWTIFHDPDEYLAINGDVVEGTERLLTEPGIVLKMVEHLRYNATATETEDYAKKVITIDTSTRARVDGGRGPEAWLEHFQKSHCITFARALYGVVESTKKEISRDVPPSLDPLRFDTLRFRYRATARGATRFDAVKGGHDGPGKSILDVSKIRPADFSGGATNAHRPLASVCTSVWAYSNMPLGFHHYIGSWEAYSARDDARDRTIHGREMWEGRSRPQFGGPDDEIRPWIAGFVKLVGEETAGYMLKGAGIMRVPEKRRSFETATGTRRR